MPRTRQHRSGVLSVFAWLAVLLLSGNVRAAEADAYDTAAEVVRSTANAVLEVLQNRRADLEADPGLIYDIVDEIVVPKFDFERITRSALGRHWRDASESERQDVSQAFQRLLVRTYAGSLLDYSGQQVHILPSRAGTHEGRVVVHTEVSDRNRGVKVPVDYKLHRKGGNWLAYDVIIDGVSLVVNYRNSFAREIQRGGIAGLIESLRAKQGGRQGS